MIYIGMNNKEKEKIISEYVNKNDISHVIIFSGEIGGQVTKKSVREPRMSFSLDCSSIAAGINATEIQYRYAGDAPADVPYRTVERYGWADSILYRVFYPLLGRIDNTYLIVFNEFMRSQNRSSLEYNCVAKYTGQTTHVLTFEYFPIIDNTDDFMILVDLDTSQRFKGIGINSMDMANIYVSGLRHGFNIDVTDAHVGNDALIEYKEETERLFSELCDSDPETVPRKLHVWSGKFKVGSIKQNEMYVARNKRFKRSNIVTYKEVIHGGEYIIIDFPARRIEFNDFLKITGIERASYISSGLPIDKVYINGIEEWKVRCAEIYDKTGI